MKPAIAILFLATLTSQAAAQGVPMIDIAPSCRAESTGTNILPENYDACRRSEESARETLVKQWSGFPPADRKSCYRLTTTGTPGTYTELLTCLEMKRDARNLPGGSTVGRGIGPRN